MQQAHKLIVSGNGNYGLAKSLRTRFPSSTFASRSTGYDFTSGEDRRRFAQISLGFDAYISCSSLVDFLQLILLKEVYETWRDAGKGGQIIAIGSTIDLEVKGRDRVYAFEKKALKDYCTGLSLLSCGPKPGGAKPIRVTHISPGYLNTPSILRKNPGIHALDCDYLAELIDWAMCQPPNISIHHLSLDPIQSVAPN